VQVQADMLGLWQIASTISLERSKNERIMFLTIMFVLLVLVVVEGRTFMYVRDMWRELDKIAELLRAIKSNSSF